MSAESPADASSSDPNVSAESVHHDPVAESVLDARAAAPARPGRVVAGVSVARVVGAYPRLLDTGAHVVDGLRSAVLGPERSARTRAAFRDADLWLLAMLALGMLAMVFTMAGVMRGFVEDQPELSRGLFLGM